VAAGDADLAAARRTIVDQQNGPRAMKRLWAHRSVRIASLVLLVVAVATAASVGTYYLTRPSASADPTTSRTAQTTESTVAAALSTIKQSISVFGTLTPTVQESVGFAVSGTVTSVKVSAGEAVTKGQVLATIGTLSLKSELASARATLASAKARLASDRNTLTSQQTKLATANDDLATAEDDQDATQVTDFTAQITSIKAQITSVKAQIAADRNSITVAESGVSTAEDNLTSATLKAPVAGLVTTVDIAKGDAVTGSGSSGTGSSGTGSSGTGSSGSGSNGSGSGAAGGQGLGGSSQGSSCGSGLAAFVIVGTSSWEVDVSVSDSQVGLLKVGDQVQLRTDRDPGRCPTQSPAAGRRSPPP
jgi:macrolide-specific efflux system membrane fusion protein